jgi:hypothetical protein
MSFFGKYTFIALNYKKNILQENQRIGYWCFIEHVYPSWHSSMTMTEAQDWNLYFVVLNNFHVPGT